MLTRKLRFSELGSPSELESPFTNELLFAFRETDDELEAHDELEPTDEFGAQDDSEAQDDYEVQDDYEAQDELESNDDSETFDDETPGEEGENLEPEELGLIERQVPVSTGPTLGFEFDLNYGFEAEVATALGKSPPSGWSWPGEALRATEHEWKDSAGAWKDAIQVTLDSVRMEISTAPFHIDDPAEFERIEKAVHAFGKDLKAAKKTRHDRVSVGSFEGRPTTFTHPRTVVNNPNLNPDGTHEFPGDSEQATYSTSSVPLVIHRMNGKYPVSQSLWASPQATVTLPLDKFGALVWLIHETRGGDPGVAFTGSKKQRLGLRDDLAWLALTRAVADRKLRLGTELSDKTKVTDADFTRSVTGLVTILVMYMLTSVEFDERDERKEGYAKGSLPLNVKTPLWQIHKFALTDRERQVFKELYGAPGQRANLYALAKAGSDSSAGSTKLFPSYTHGDVERFFTTLPTWKTLVEAVIDEKPVLVTKENFIAKKKHKQGDEILIAPLSNKIVWDKTKPRIAVEMRRMGFDAVPFSTWRGLMKRLLQLAQKVNS